MTWLSLDSTRAKLQPCAGWLSQTVPQDCKRRAGYHIGKHARSELEYAHKVVVPIAERIRLLNSLVCEGFFDPDMPRLRRWVACLDFEDGVNKLIPCRDAKVHKNM